MQRLDANATLSCVQMQRLDADATLSCVQMQRLDTNATDLWMQMQRFVAFASLFGFPKSKKKGNSHGRLSPLLNKIFRLRVFVVCQLFVVETADERHNLVHLSLAVVDIYFGRAFETLVLGGIL